MQIQRTMMLINLDNETQVATKPNLVDCAPHPRDHPINWSPSQNLLAEDNNSAKNLDRSLSSVVWGISRRDLSYPKSQGTHPPRSICFLLQKKDEHPF